MDWKTLYRELRILNWAVLLILSSLSYLLMSEFLTLGIILGGLIIIANFNVLQYTISRVFNPVGTMKSGKASIIVKSYFRLLALGVILYFLITRGWVDPVGLAVGLSTVVFSIVFVGIQRAFKMINGEAI